MSTWAAISGLGTSDDRVTSLFDTRTFGCDDPEGVAYDPQGDRLFIADGLGSEIWEVRAGPNRRFEGSGDDVIRHFDATALGLYDPETVEYNPDKGTLYVVDKDAVCMELSTDGAVLNTLDLSAGHLRSPAGMCYAPSSNNPSRRSLYVVCRGTDNDSDPRENDGTLFEYDLGPGPSGGGGPTPPSGGNTSSIRVAAGSDDAEESSSGSVTLTSGDLELVYDGTCRGWDCASRTWPSRAGRPSPAPTFSSPPTSSTARRPRSRFRATPPTTPVRSPRELQRLLRPRTAASVAWAPPAWTTVGDAGAAQRTPNLATVVQEIVNRPGWASGNCAGVRDHGQRSPRGGRLRGRRQQGAAPHDRGRARPNQAPWSMPVPIRRSRCRPRRCSTGRCRMTACRTGS